MTMHGGVTSVLTTILLLLLLLLLLSGRVASHSPTRWTRRLGAARWSVSSESRRRSTTLTH